LVPRRYQSAEVDYIGSMARYCGKSAVIWHDSKQLSVVPQAIARLQTRRTEGPSVPV
jgi:hypothetical protein